VAAAISPTEVGWGGWTTMLDAKRSMRRGYALDAAVSEVGNHD
jgi:hypothetical protein